MPAEPIPKPTKLVPPLSAPVQVRMDWIARAARLPGKTLHVAMALWWLVCLARSAEIGMTRTVLFRFGISRDACYDALRHLETAGLVAVHRSPGRCPRVVLLDTDQRPLRIARAPEL